MYLHGRMVPSVSGPRTIFIRSALWRIDEILEKCREIKPDAVATIASDLANITVSKVAAGLGLPGNTPECIELSTNKYAMRSAFLKAGLPTPKFYKVDRVIPELMEMELPVIVKPTDRSGSRAITKITAYDQLEEAIKEAVEQSFERKPLWKNISREMSTVMRPSLIMEHIPIWR